MSAQCALRKNDAKNWSAFSLSKYHKTCLANITNCVSQSNILLAGVTSLLQSMLRNLLDKPEFKEI